jgi:hypothetical protein
MCIETSVVKIKFAFDFRRKSISKLFERSDPINLKVIPD